MDIRRLDQGTVVIEDLDLFLCDLLQQIPSNADPGNDENAQTRLYSSPTHGAEPNFDEEWREYVEPELRQAFQSAVETVREDMAGFSVAETSYQNTIVIPVSHLESWIHALNQARLALGARFEVNEEDMDEIPTSGDGRALAIFQIHFYGYLQERFLQELGA